MTPGKSLSTQAWLTFTHSSWICALWTRGCSSSIRCGTRFSSAAIPAVQADLPWDKWYKWYKYLWVCPQVEAPELAKVFVINAIAPFVLNSKLKPLMLRGRTAPVGMPVKLFAATGNRSHLYAPTHTPQGVAHLAPV